MSRISSASFVRLSLLCLAAGVCCSTSFAAEKTFSYFRFTPTRLRDNANSNSVQVADFKLRLRGTAIDMTKATVTNTGGNNPGGEGPANLLDGNPGSKWLDFNKAAVVFRFPAAVTVDAYAFVTANDAMERDPGNWRLEGSSNGTSWVLLDEQVNGSVPEDRGVATPDFPLPVTVAPYVSFWHPDYLLKWTPAGDTASDFNRSFVPLAARSSNAALNVNSNARPNEGKVTVLTTFGSTSFQPAQGSAVEHFNAYTGWQYTDKLVFWGGSAGEGVIIAPSAPVTDAGHRNGVPVLGTVFFPPNVYGGQIHWVRSLLQRNGTTFPVADKMIEVCRYYGFDGWFLNQETGGGNAGDAGDMRDFISYFRAQAPELQIQWYDAMDEGGNVSWQNALNGNNDMYMSYNGQPVAHSMFLNFWWNSSMLANSRTTAQNLGINPYSIYAGIDVESAGSGTNADWNAIFPSGQPHRLSVSFYGAQSMFRNTGNPSDFQKSEIRFWSGANGDPSNTATSSSWKGLANYIPANTPVQKLPFVTNFNRGQGNRYMVEGVQLGSAGWNNLSLQDVLPTWKWIITSSTSNKLTPSLELDDAYSGGTSLKVAGTLDGTNDLKLYAASLPLTDQSRFRLVLKSNQGSGATSMQVALAFEDSPQTFVYLPVGSAGGTGWRTKDLDLSPYAGRKIAVIGLRFAPTVAISNYEMRLGRILIYDGTLSVPQAVTNLRVTQQDSLDSDSLAVRLKWDASTTPGIYYYQVIQRFADGSRKWLGATPSTAFYIPRARRSSNEGALTFQVQAVGADFGTSTVANVSASLPPAPDTTYVLSGSSIGTPGSYANNGMTAGKSYDGDTSTYFDSPDDAAWTGLDFGAGKSKLITAFRYFPRSGWAFRMTGGVFEAANQPDFSDAVLLHTVTADPADGVYTTVPVTRTEKFRYFRYRSNTGHGNVAEIKVYGYELPAAPTGVTATFSRTSADLNWSPATWATDYKVERALTAGGAYTSLGVFSDPDATDLNPPAGQGAYYRITSINVAGEGGSTVVQAVPESPYFAWQLQYFGNESSAAIIGSEADPDRDGVPNLMEYALGTSPLVRSPLDLQPKLTGDGRVAVIYPKSAGSTDITLNAEWSDDLTTWSAEGVSYEQISAEGQPPVIRASAPAGGDHRFMRLIATGQ